MHSQHFWQYCYVEMYSVVVNTFCYQLKLFQLFLFLHNCCKIHLLNKCYTLEKLSAQIFHSPIVVSSETNTSSGSIPCNLRQATCYHLTLNSNAAPHRVIFTFVLSLIKNTADLENSDIKKILLFINVLQRHST